MLRSRRKHTPLVRLALALSAAALLMASTAAADDPIVTIGEVGGNGAPTTSGSVGDEGTADVCLNEDHSGVDSAESTPVALNDSNCTSSTVTGGPSGGGGGGGGNNTTTSSRPTSTTTPTSTTGPRGSAGWVSASSARGLRIVGVRTVLTGVRSTKRFRVVVTLRDLNGKLVRGAIVKIDRVPGAVNTIRGRDAAFTNRVGKARLVASVATKQLGTRVLLRITARTPKMRALQLRSVFVR